MLTKSLNDLTIADLESLVSESVQESRTLDFKRDLVGQKDDDKREFLADVSAFANTAGGDLVFGIEEQQGIAVSLSPLRIADPDAEIRRLESILRSGLEPRLPHVEVRWLPKSDGYGLLVVRTSRSWAAPHRVTFRDSKFYGRGGTSKYPLDVAELRSAFVASESIVQSVRQFRSERVATIESDEGPVPLRPTAKVIFHLIPLSAFGGTQDIALDFDRSLIQPLGSGSGYNHRHTLEGVATYRGREDMIESMYTYALMFRTGIIESVSAIGRSDEHGLLIYPETVEWDLIRVFSGYCNALAAHEIKPPYYAFLSFIGIRNHRLFIPRGTFTSTQRRDVLLLPEIQIEDSTQKAEKALRPLFDLFWNAFGFGTSMNFDKKGEYKGERY